MPHPHTLSGLISTNFAPGHSTPASGLSPSLPWHGSESGPWAGGSLCVHHPARFLTPLHLQDFAQMSLSQSSSHPKWKNTCHPILAQTTLGLWIYKGVFLAVAQPGERSELSRDPRGAERQESPSSARERLRGLSWRESGPWPPQKALEPRAGARSSLPTRGAGSTSERGTCAPGVAPVPPGRPRGQDLWVAASRPPRHARRGSKSDAHGPSKPRRG